MKRKSSDTDKWVFELSQEERHILLFLLKSYPMQSGAWPDTGHSPHQGVPIGPDPALLTHELDEFKTSLKGRVDGFIDALLRTDPDQESGLLTIRREDSEWLLQVLNEVRIGAWYALGCPEEAHSLEKASSPENFRHVVRVEYAGFFQSHLLHELDPD